MKRTLALQAVPKFLLGILLTALLLFLPAGTLRYPNAWLLLAVLFLPMLIAGIVLLIKNPTLLQLRLKAKETRQKQDRIVKLSALMFLLGFLCAGLDFRYQWSHLPLWASCGAAGLFILAYLLYAEVLRENAYLSRTIEVQAHQTVVDTGLYGIVRHPMYSATLLLFLSMPLILGSLVSLAMFLLYPVLIVRRIRDEEALLAAELDGYAAYQHKVRYKLIPFIW